jgi:hypothetical protein
LVVLVVVVVWILAATDKTIPDAIETVLNHCSNGEIAQGAMVGWSNHKVIPIKTGKELQANEYFIRFGKLSTSNFKKFSSIMNITRDSPIGQINWVLENVAVHLYVLLTASFSKFNHNLFHLQHDHGPFIYIDNDRSNWRYAARNRSAEAAARSPVFRYCRFPAHIASRLFALAPQIAIDSSRASSFPRPTIANPNSMGNIIREATLDLDMPFLKEETGGFFSVHEANMLDINVQHVVDGIRNCIDRYGIENVLIPEPWLLHDKQYMKQYIELQRQKPNQQQQQQPAKRRP